MRLEFWILSKVLCIFRILIFLKSDCLFINSKGLWGSNTINNVQTNGGICSSFTGSDKSLARPRKKQATATEDFEFHISYL